jgi:hypothetical protein
MPAAARFAAPAASSGCSAPVPAVLSWVPTATMTCRRAARACRLCSWSKPPFFSGMTRLARSVVFALGGPASLRRPGGRRRRGADIAPLPVGQGARPACCRPFPVAAAATRAA